MSRRVIPFATAFLLLLAICPGSARALSVEEAIDRFFVAESLEPEWFAPSFLQAVSFAQLEPIRQQLSAGLGAYSGAAAVGDRYMAYFAEGRIPVYASLDGEGRFVGLRLLLPIPKMSDLDEVTAKFDALPGSGSLLLIVDGQEQLAQNADEAFAVGSAFKLQILQLLLEDVEAGERSWSDVVELSAGDKPMPGGTLSSWPDGSPLTLHTAAVLMISESDNTATDLLIRVLGRDRLDAASADGRNQPFLSTREAFQLKDPRNAAWLKRWRAGDAAARAIVLGELRDRPAPGPEIFAEGIPREIDVEWFFTARELCALIAALQTLDLMTVNAGVVSKDEFERVAYKGGSEPGVLNFTTWALDDEGREICVCATRNADEAIELPALAEVVMGAFEVVGQE